MGVYDVLEYPWNKAQTCQFCCDRYHALAGFVFFIKAMAVSKPPAPHLYTSISGLILLIRLIL